MKSHTLVSLAGALLLAAAAMAETVPSWGAKKSMPVGTAPASLKPGEFIWGGNAIPAGPVVVVVSLEEQRASVYRNGIRIGVTTVSSGKPGYQTPTGVFTILQKDKDHRSSKYNDAPMPYTERLTWSGVALHGRPHRKGRSRSCSAPRTAG
jgi:lipoprotein-anchoring transpeptidase ErfK/SrfK